MDPTSRCRNSEVLSVAMYDPRPLSADQTDLNTNSSLNWLPPGRVQPFSCRQSARALAILAKTGSYQTCRYQPEVEVADDSFAETAETSASVNPRIEAHSVLIKRLDLKPPSEERMS